MVGMATAMDNLLQILVFFLLLGNVFQLCVLFWGNDNKGDARRLCRCRGQLCLVTSVISSNKLDGLHTNAQMLKTLAKCHAVTLMLQRRVLI